ncbi:MAG: iron chaperone [Anaerolineae bacterium]
MRSCLERIRSIVRETAPGCTERVSYGIPIFRLQKDLVGMSAHENHCSFHTMSPPLVQAMAEELKGVKVSGATIHFTLDKPLPEELIVRIVRERMKALGAA